MRNIQPNPVIMTSVYATPCPYLQVVCGTRWFLTVNRNIALFGYNDTKYSVPLMTL